ncbi:hypothetical protein D3C72_1017910 [compost metagenome]
MLADLVVDLLVAQVGLDPQTGRPELGGDLFGVTVGVRGDGRHHGLGRRQPQREGPGVVLDHDADEALERAQDGAVQHDRAVLLAVLGDVGRVQTVRQDIVQLDRAAGPFAADGVLDDEVQLGRVEGAVALGDHHIDPGVAGGFGHLGLGLVPELVRTGAHLGTGGQVDIGRLHAEVGVDRLGQLDELGRLVDDLVFAAEDVGVVLGEAAHAHQAVQRTGRLIAVAGAELGHAQRQFAIGPLALIEDLHVAGAVHRLQGKGLALHRLADEHVGTILLPVARGLPELAVQHLRRLDLDIARGVQTAAHIGLQHAPQDPALGVPEDHAAALFLHVEELHGAAQLAVVALLGLFDAQQIGVQVLLGRPGGAVDALQLGARGITAPVGAGQLGQLEGLADELGGREVRPPAQVGPFALLVDGDGLRARQVADQLGLVGLAHRLEMLDRRVAVPDLTLQRGAPVDDLAHLLFDLGEVVGREGLVAGEVVIEAVLDGRADGDLGAGEELLHGLGQHVGGVVTDGLQRLGIVAHQQAEVAVAVDDAVQVALLAVPDDQGRLLGQRGRDGGGHVAARRAGRILTHGAVGEFQFDHDGRSFSILAGGTGS